MSKKILQKITKLLRKELIILMKKELELHLVLDEYSMDSLYLILSFYKMTISLLPISGSKYGKFADELMTVIEKIKKDEKEV